MLPLEVAGIKELEVWLKLFDLDSAGITSRKFSSLYDVARQIDEGKNPSGMSRIVVDRAFKMGLVFEKDGFFEIDVDKLSDTLAELKIYDYFQKLIHYNGD